MIRNFGKFSNLCLIKLTMRKNLFFLIVLSVVSSVAGLSAAVILSPVPGTWANRQPLVLQMAPGDEAFYSYSGTDPLESGFAYDGPVLIDAAGTVKLRVAVVSGDSTTTETTIEYTVSEQDSFSSSDEETFITKMTAPVVYEYTSGESLAIPQTLAYRFGNDSQTWIKGRTISVSRKSLLNRLVPFTITDGSSLWHVVIHASSPQIGLLSRQDVPFTISRWKTVVFTNQKLIYSIDGADWKPAGNPVELDRSVRHMIRWQSVAYEAGNPVQYYVVPPEPGLAVHTNSDAETEIQIQGDDSYMAGTSGAASSSYISAGLFRTIGLDTFYGDTVSGTLNLSLWSDGVYQGELSVPYRIDRQPPSPPGLQTNIHTLFARKPVKVTFAGEKDAKIYSAVSKSALLTNDDFKTIAVSGTDSIKTTAGPYTEQGVTGLTLDGDPQGAILYRVTAYAVDAAENKSESSTYSVIVDEYNYYVAADSKAADADGSVLKPFKDFSGCAALVNSQRFARIHLKGSVTLPAGDTVFAANCEIVGTDDARISIPAGASVILRSASLSASDIIFEKKAADEETDKNSDKMFVLEHAVADFTGCEIIGKFTGNGTVFTAYTSVINLNNCGLTAQADSYAAGISSNDSKITVEKSRISTIADTSVNFSVQQGSFVLRSTNCKVVGRLGRIAELVGTRCRITDNTFTAEPDKKSGTSAVWKDKSVVTLDEKGNRLSGF